MNLIITYIQNFLKRSGNYVFIATITARIFSFISSWIALQLIDNKKLGIVLFAWNIIVFLMPFIGLGLPQSLIRYGALLKNKRDKEILLYYVIKKGTFITILLSFIVSIIGLLYPFKYENTGIYIALFSLSFIPFFILEIIKIQYRLEHNNKAFAKVDISYHTVLLALVFFLSYYYQEKGYIGSFILAPTIVSLLFYKKIKKTNKSLKKLTIINLSFWKYGFFGGLSNVASTLLFSIDILLIGILKNPECVTAFRYISIIPFSVLFIPRVFINTDFVSFTEKIYQKEYIFNYIKSYMYLFTIISFLYLGFFYIFDTTTLSIFDIKFTQYSDSFLILNIGVCGILIFRGLFGNLLSAIGLVKINYYITSFAVVINIISNYYIIPIFGIKGAAITSASLMWFTGLLSCVAFFYYYKKLSLKQTQ